MVLTLCSFPHAKQIDPYTGEVDEPVAEAKNNVSEATIIHQSEYKEYSPINPVKPGVNKEEYDSVDNLLLI